MAVRTATYRETIRAIRKRGAVVKATIGIPITITIPDEELPGLARRARKRGALTHLRGILLEELIEQARLDGLLDIDEYWIRPGDEDRIFLRGEITTSQQEWKRQKILRSKRRK